MRSARRSSGAARPTVAASAMASSRSSSRSMILGSRLYKPSAMTPTPPTGVPARYNGKPPGSAARPSGERFGPASGALPAKRAERSEQANWLNCTPNNGPPGASASPGLKCDWTIWLAVRVLNALPSLDRYAPVTALAIAAIVVGTTLKPSRPPSIRTEPRVLRTITVDAAPFIAYTASTLPTRSTTAMVARALRAWASATARAMTPSTCATPSAVPAFAQKPSQAGFTAPLPAPLPLATEVADPWPPPPPQAASSAATTSAPQRRISAAPSTGRARP